MIAEKIQETKEMKATTDNHLSWCAEQVAKNMTESEIREFAAEAGTSRFPGTVRNAYDGINAKGEPVADQAYWQREIIRMVASWIINTITRQ